MMAEAPLDAAALRAEISQTRADLGQTVAALAAKTDVKARTLSAVEDVKESVGRRARAGVDSLHAAPWSTTARVATGAAIGALVGALIYLATRRTATRRTVAIGRPR
jgi:ABC-type nitrate/sulfonate/bicarbonate transport system permease component